jgi:putative tryptophan/tyrosine transport system substrate-binding protein
MRRREFITLLSGAAASGWPCAAMAQQAMPVLGFLSSGPANARQDQFAMLHRALKEGGYVEGQNLVVEYRWANDQYDRLPALAAELVQRRVAVIAATGGPVTALAAKAATNTIPIVFTGVSDPVKYGLVASFNRPGGNVTGSAGLTTELDAKRFEVLREVVPTANTIGALFNPNRPGVEAQIQDFVATAQAATRRLIVIRAGTEPELEAAFATRMRQPVDALVVTADPFFNSVRRKLVELLARHRVPAIYQWREFTKVGGLVSYGPSILDAYHQGGVYIARILKGEKPADLPVVQPAKFELVINLRTAKELGLAVPAALLARADETIE